jgi:hypothetical protein
LLPLPRQPSTSASRSEGGGCNSHRRHSYQKVLEGRKQPIRGLWTRNGSYIARVRVPGDDGSMLFQPSFARPRAQPHGLFQTIRTAVPKAIGSTVKSRK